MGDISLWTGINQAEGQSFASEIVFLLQDKVSVVVPMNSLGHADERALIFEHFSFLLVLKDHVEKIPLRVQFLTSRHLRA